MKQLLLSIAAISATTFAVYLQSAGEPGSARGYKMEKAVPVHAVRTIVLDTVLTLPSTGERIRFRGTGAYETNGTLKKNQVTTLSRLEMKGISGVGTRTGHTYAGNGHVVDWSQAALQGGTAAWTEQQEFRMQPNGGGAPFTLVATVRVSVVAGEPEGMALESFRIKK
ncbi:hypothetical protein V9K67_09585 [Paraflavisolibacter sp. H34]|uniref:hypothetical protein n=1 Tax=Huijunlia imazamoxiresistens TaxID=3127457 RepID=UPI00301601CA